MNYDVLATAVVAVFVVAILVAGLWESRRRTMAVLFALVASPVLFILTALTTVNTPMDGFSTGFVLAERKPFERDVSMSLGRGTYGAALEYSFGPKEELDLRYDLRLDGKLVESREIDEPLVLKEGTNNYGLGIIRIKEPRGEVSISIHVRSEEIDHSLPVRLSISRIW